LATRRAVMLKAIPPGGHPAADPAGLGLRQLLATLAHGGISSAATPRAARGGPPPSGPGMAPRGEGGSGPLRPGLARAVAGGPALAIAEAGVVFPREEVP